VHLCSARSGKAANVLANSYKWNRNVLSLFVKFSRKTVPHPRFLDSEAAVAVVCSGAWNSQSAGVSGLKTPTGDC